MDRAEQHYRQALALDPSYAEAHSNLAFLLSSQGKYDEAAAAAQQAIELSPRLIDAYLNLAEVEVSRHRHDAALRARRGDPAAAAEFVRGTQGDVWRVCAHLGSRADQGSRNLPGQDAHSHDRGRLHPWLQRFWRPQGIPGRSEERRQGNPVYQIAQRKR